MALTLITKILFVILRKYLPYVLNISRLKSILQSRLDFEGGNILLRKLWVCITTRLVLRSISNYIMFFKSFSYKKNYLDWPNEPDYTLSGPLKFKEKKLNWSKKVILYVYRPIVYTHGMWIWKFIAKMSCNISWVKLNKEIKRRKMEKNIFWANEGYRLQ